MFTWAHGVVIAAWKSRYGQQTGSGAGEILSAPSLPEPASAIYSLCYILVLCQY
jgi:hypothetical protein